MAIDKALLPLLKHHADRARRGLIKNAIRNCHVHGLHSIMLHDEPGNRVRMFYCDPNHELWMNDFSSKKFSLAIHPHHCDLTLQIVDGHVYNTEYRIAKNPTAGILWLDEYCYESAILGAAGSLLATGNRFQFFRWVDKLHTKRLQAADLHNVAVYRGQQAAWLVYEGKEDPNYRSVCYTNNPIFDPKDMYLKDPTVALEAFKWLNLI